MIKGDFCEECKHYMEIVVKRTETSEPQEAETCIKAPELFSWNHYGYGSKLTRCNQFKAIGGEE